MSNQRRRKFESFSDPNNIPMQRSSTSPKIQAVIDKIKPKPSVMSPSFLRPKSEDEWKSFHTTNEEGMRKSYEAPEGYYKEGNKLFIAGTRDIQDVMDWPKIPLGMFKDSKIYKNADEVFKNDPTIDYVVGHSAGGSAALELEKNYPTRHITSVTYSAPVFEPIADPEKIMNKDKAPLRFTHVGDVVSAFDMNAQTSFQAPSFNMDLMKDAYEMYNSPSLDTVGKVKSSMGTFDPTMGLHSMNSSYSNPSSTMDFVRSGIQGVTIAKGAGLI
jgi:hypothetical protein